MVNRYPSNFRDLTGQVIGNFEVIKLYDRKKDGHVRWLCKCLSCGNLTKLTSYELTHKKKKSCGCLTNNIISQKNTKHGLRQTRIYNIWAKLRARCYRKTDRLFSYYGERGIRVCEEWNSHFISFYNWALENGYEDNLTIDRIDVNGDYEPNNCRWVNMKAQCNNKRNNIIIMYKGKEQTLKQWCEELQVDYKLVHGRIKYRGWSIEKALTTPSQRKGRENE